MFVTRINTQSGYEHVLVLKVVHFIRMEAIPLSNPEVISFNYGYLFYKSFGIPETWMNNPIVKLLHKLA
jgi:hypothetical protein